MRPAVKGWIHLALAALAGYEVAQSTTKGRKFLNAVTAGYHAHAALYHFVWEETDEIVSEESA